MSGRNLSAEVSVASAEVTKAADEVPRIGNLAVLDLGVKQATIDNLAARGFEVHVLPQDVDDRRHPRDRPCGGLLLQRSRRPGGLRRSRRAPARRARRRPAVLRDLLRQPAARARSRARHVQAALRAPRHQSAGAGQVHRAGRDHRRTTTASPSTRRWRASSTARTATGGSRSATSGLNDDVVEGLRALDIPAFSVQYHPEAAAGPHDANYLFDRFADMVSRPPRQERRECPSVMTSAPSW